MATAASYGARAAIIIYLGQEGICSLSLEGTHLVAMGLFGSLPTIYRGEPFWICAQKRPLSAFLAREGA